MEGVKCSSNQLLGQLAQELPIVGRGGRSSELVGHIVNDITFRRSGKSYPVQVPRAAVERLSYDIDLSRIDNYIAKCRAKSTGFWLALI